LDAAGLEHDRDVGLAGGDLDRQLDGAAAVGLLLDACDDG